MAVRHKNLDSKTRPMLRDVHPSVQPHVKCHQAFSITCNAVVLPPLPTVESTLIPVSAMLLHYPGDHVHQHPLGPGTSSRRRPPVVDVPALDDKKALYVARLPERASDKAKRVDNSKWWARVVLFLCCVSPSNDDGH
ncbi:uncharacterized protein F5891DRAFT_1172365 [Suillus fuscotomentosus]|uniref:Uncharacterized protein n=1 Tax=Suillus fuscotomentosus TaxID=1912939 RepID=A0AAD4E9A6_9AGAM|nr:uncharacterized protein F5891DRAFT_1172365 [Suillus fuscotomentosus]KAG1901955.1 hypothetical protein F5891DRAFT_1172365 [Suillus fuscotomentosus]